MSSRVLFPSTLRPQALREAVAKWTPIWEQVRPVLVAHLRPLKLTANLVLQVTRTNSDLSNWSFEQVKKTFGVAFEDKTIALVFALAVFVGCDTRAEFVRDAKLFRFPLGELEKIEKQMAAAVKAAAKPAAPAKGGPAKTPKSPSKSKTPRVAR